MSSLRKGLLMRIAPRGLTSGSVNNQVEKRGNNGFSGAQAILLRKLRKTHPLPNFKITNLILWEILSDPLTASAYVSPPIADVNNCWRYINAGNPDKAEWFFYVDPTTSTSDGYPPFYPPGTVDWIVPVSLGAPPSLLNKVSDLEAFYIVIKLNNTDNFNKPWIKIYTRIQGDGNDAGTFYRTRYNYASFHDNGSLYPLQKREYVFYIGNIEKIIPTFSRSTPRYNLQEDWGPSVLPIVDKAPGNATPEMDPISGILISTNSTEDAGTFDFCLKEVGYKFKGKQQQVLKTIVR
jgi:hypothetical protein